MAITAPPTITALPTPPDPNDRSTFNTRAYPWSVALQPFSTDLTAVADNVHNNALEAQDQAGIATTKASEASASAALAQDWATKTSDEVVAGQGFGAKKYADDAALSADAAAASALEAAGLVENYQGALAADPTLDKEGNPLAAGDWYINTATGFVRAYNGSAWVQGISVVAGVSRINGLVGDLTGFVTETGAQSLTNKTLTDPKLLLGGTNGTAGQVPISQGDELPPVWGSKQDTLVSGTNIKTINGSSVLGAGDLTVGESMILLSTVTANNNATVDVEYPFDSTYDAYALVVSGVTVASAATLYLRAKAGGAYLSTNEYHQYIQLNTSGSSTLSQVSDNSQTRIDLTLGDMDSATPGEFSAVLLLHMPASNRRKIIRVDGCYWNSTPRVVSVEGAIGINTTSALQGIRFYGSSGNILTGDFRLYGIKKS